jgi:hypothetical protein
MSQCDCGHQDRGVEPLGLKTRRENAAPSLCIVI